MPADEVTPPQIPDVGGGEVGRSCAWSGSSGAENGQRVPCLAGGGGPLCGERPASLAPVCPAEDGCLSLKAAQGVRYVVSARSDGSVEHHGWRAGDGPQQDRVETATSRAAVGPLNAPRAPAPTSSIPPLWRPFRRLVNSAPGQLEPPRPLPNRYSLRDDRQTACSAAARRMTRRRGRLVCFRACLLPPEGPGTAWDPHPRPAPRAAVARTRCGDRRAAAASHGQAGGDKPMCLHGSDRRTPRGRPIGHSASWLIGRGHE